MNTDELVGKLRSWGRLQQRLDCSDPPTETPEMVFMAADTIERLQRELEEYKQLKKTGDTERENRILELQRELEEARDRDKKLSKKVLDANKALAMYFCLEEERDELKAELEEARAKASSVDCTRREIIRTRNINADLKAELDRVKAEVPCYGCGGTGKFKSDLNPDGVCIICKGTGLKYPTKGVGDG